ncbi:hypothetical protein HQ544_01480 [Candidatus Falkowbacteria bacterium]|nr:hypothetical protein [Candidatus Falkowbacteria bacterium]
MDNNIRHNSFRFIIIIALVGIFLILGIIYFDSHQKFTRDQKRVGDIQKIQIALDEYYKKHGTYPAGEHNWACSGGHWWDVAFWRKSTSDTFINELVHEGFLEQQLSDPIFYGDCNNSYHYHYFQCTPHHLKTPRYPCYGLENPFYVLGVKKLETKKAKLKFASPGFSGPTRNWAEEFDYVVGKNEK